MPMIKGSQSKTGTPVTVSRCNKEDWKNPETNTMLYAFDVKMDNGDEGIYRARDVNNPKMKEGESCDYIIDTMTSNKNPDWKKLYFRKDTKFEKTGGGSKYKEKSIEEQKSIIFQVSLTASTQFGIELESAGISIDSKFITELATQVYSHVLEKVLVEGKISIQNSITYCSAIKIGLLQITKSTLSTKNIITDITLYCKKVDIIYSIITPENFKPKKA